MSANHNTAPSHDMFGNFDIVETVGQGGMGIVYRAHDVTLNRDVALKVLKDDLRALPKVVARFQREAEAIASLDHPHIVQVYSVGTIGKIPYFAMEFIEGKPLSRILRRHKALRWKDALRIARDIAEALASAHDSQIIHRDIKPGNIIVNRDGRAFVTDFGIAKVMTADTQLTVDGSRLGTPQYMSPERCQNQDITHASDLYSLGVVLFQMLTSRLPYEASDPIELVRKIVTEPPARVRDYKSDVPEDVERLTAYLLEKKPEHRPVDAHEAVELIGRLLDGKPLFDSDSGIDSALDDLREDVTTPHSDTTIDQDSVQKPPAAERIRAAVESRWRAVPSVARLGLVCAACAMAGGLVGTTALQTIQPERAGALVNQFSAHTDSWYQESALARFEQERTDLQTVTFQLPDHRVAAIARSEKGEPIATFDSDGGLAIALIDTRTLATSSLAAANYLRDDEMVVGAGSDSTSPEPIIFTASLAAPHRFSAIGSNGATLDPFAVPDRAAGVRAYQFAKTTLAVLRGLAGGAYALERWTRPESDQDPAVLFQSTRELRNLQLGCDNTTLTVEDVGADGQAVLLILSEESTRRVAVEGWRVLPYGLNDAGSHLLVALPEESEHVLGVINLARGDAVTPLEDASRAHWLDENTVAVLARDRRDWVQAWALSIDAPSERRQLTFYDGGLDPAVFSRGPDGRIAVAAKNAAQIGVLGP